MDTVEVTNPDAVIERRSRNQPLETEADKIAAAIWYDSVEVDREFFQLIDPALDCADWQYEQRGRTVGLCTICNAEQKIDGWNISYAQRRLDVRKAELEIFEVEWDPTIIL